MPPARRPGPSTFPIPPTSPSRTTTPKSQPSSTGCSRVEPADRDDNSFNRARLARGRVVKDISSTNLLPWIVDRYPEVPVVYLLRHPVPVAWSQASMGWGTLGPYLRHGTGAGDDPPLCRTELMRQTFVENVLRWCLENVVPLTTLAPDAAHVVLYEEAVRDPEAELGRLATYLHRFGHPWSRWSAVRAPTARPSSTDFRRTSEHPGDRAASWRHEVPASWADEAGSVVAAFGLDRIYGPDADPRMHASEVLDTTSGPPRAARPMATRASGGGRPSPGAPATTVRRWLIGSAVPREPQADPGSSRPAPARAPARSRRGRLPRGGARSGDAPGSERVPPVIVLGAPATVTPAVRALVDQAQRRADPRMPERPPGIESTVRAATCSAAVPWLTEHRPPIPVVVVLRHPLSVRGSSLGGDGTGP